MKSNEANISVTSVSHCYFLIFKLLKNQQDQNHENRWKIAAWFIAKTFQQKNNK